MNNKKQPNHLVLVSFDAEAAVVDIAAVVGTWTTRNYCFPMHLMSWLNRRSGNCLANIVAGDSDYHTDYYC